MSADGNDRGPAAGEAADRSRRRSRGWWSPIDQRNPSGARVAGATVWLGFIIFPLVNAITGKGTPLGHTLVIAGAAVFVACYVRLVLQWRIQRARIPSLLLFGTMLAISAALTVWQAPGWGFLFTYCAACAALVTPTGFWAVALCSVLAGVCTAIGGANGGTIIGFVASSAGIGLLMLVMRDLRVRNMELTEARAELARLAVAEERERFARDLHDLLGHSLSVIALKAELAGRLLAHDPSEAAGEVAELEQVARTALTEVREAVSGYRQPTLDGELAGARMALSAAGIEADVQHAHVSLDPTVEAVLAWAVREGATNVIRHSGARHCTMKISASLTDASVEVIDDGRGVEEAGGADLPSPAGIPAPARVTAPAGIPSPADIPAPAGIPSPADIPAPAGIASPADISAPAAVSGRARVPSYAGVASGAGIPTPATAWSSPAGSRAIGGHGLAGLAERAGLLNGRIEAGPLAGGGYRLVVTVPVPHA